MHVPVSDYQIKLFQKIRIMKTIHTIISVIAALCSLLPGVSAQPQFQGPDYSRNFVVGTVVRVSGAKDTATVNALPVGSAMRTVNYYDGLGFPSQTVSVGAVGGGAHDLVLHKEYDRYMRESKVFLPYADLSGGSGQGFRDGAGAATSEFYRDGSLTGMSPDSAPWSVTVYGNSQLDRVLEHGFPGEVWQPASERTDTSGRTQAYGYGTCSSSGDDVVRLWKVVSGGISSSGDYLPGRLVRQTLMGENWVSGRDGTVDVLPTTAVTQSLSAVGCPRRVRISRLTLTMCTMSSAVCVMSFLLCFPMLCWTCPWHRMMILR